jgi:hypothetical protein
MVSTAKETAKALQKHCKKTQKGGHRNEIHQSENN